MKQTIHTLKVLFFSNLCCLLAFYGVIEFFMLDTTGGLFADCHQAEFIYQCVMVLLTLFSCYGALRLFKVKRVETELHESPLKNYQKWSVLRFTMLETPAIFNLLGYWMFMNLSFAYLFLILLLSFPFVYPTKERFINETGYTEA